VEKQYTEIAQAYKDFPALYGYDVFNEIMYSSYDRYTLEEFRNWLKNKYHSITALNDSWDRAYFNWSQIEFTRWLWASIMPLVDYREFLKDAMTRIVARWRGFIKAVDPKHPVIADDLFSMMTYDDSPLRPQDEWSIAAATDELGLSYYPGNSVPGFIPSKRAQILNGFHSAAGRGDSAGRGDDANSGDDAESGNNAGTGRFWVSELQTHFQSIFSPRTVVPLRDLRQWTWECLGGGAKGLIYWKWRPFTKGIQTSGRGLVDYRGRFNDRTREIQSIAKVIQDNAVLFNNSVPAAPHAAILYDKLNHSIHRAFLDGYTHLPQNIYIASLEGAYRALWEENIPANFITAEDLVAGKNETKTTGKAEGKTAGYNTLVVTAQILMTAELAAALLAFAERGGTVIFDGKLGVVDERAILNPVVPGGGLAEALGFEYRDIDSQGLDFTLSQGDIAASGYYERDYLDIPDTAKAEVLGSFSDGNPAVIRSAWGKGQFYYIPTYLWWGYQQGLGSPAFARWIFSRTKARTYSVSGGGLRVQLCNIVFSRSAAISTAYLAYVYEYTQGEDPAGPAAATLTIPGVPPGSYTVRSLYSGVTQKLDFDGNICLEVSAGERGVEIYHIALN
jgi:hypothetical protein